MPTSTARTLTYAGNRFCGRMRPSFRGSTGSLSLSSRRGVSGGPGPTDACTCILYAGEHVFAEHAAPGGGPSSPNVATDEPPLLLACATHGACGGWTSSEGPVGCVFMRTRATIEILEAHATLYLNISTVSFYN